MDQHSTITEGEHPSPFLNSFDIVVFGAREERWQRCREILEKEGVRHVTRYKTEIRKNKQDVTIDFINLLKLKRNTFLFFEDDFELTSGYEVILRNAWEHVPDDFDLFYLGANLTKTPKKVTENLYKMRGGWCFHAVVISHRFIEHILRTYINQRQVFDEWCRQQADYRKFYMCFPMIAYQRKGHSDYVGKEVFYDIFHNRYYEDISNRSRLSS